MAFNWIRSEFTSIQILVNNAGMMCSGFLIGKVYLSLPLPDIIKPLSCRSLDGLSAAVGGGVGEGMDRLRRTLDVNVTAACLVIREAIHTMMLPENNHNGHVILINR